MKKKEPTRKPIPFDDALRMILGVPKKRKKVTKKERKS
jgi:hypothetical protein